MPDSGDGVGDNSWRRLTYKNTKMADEAEILSNSLAKLAENEQQMGEADKDAEIYRIKKTQTIYKKRSEITKEIPQFWYIVLAQNDDFADYVRAEDLKYLDFVEDIYVHFDIADSDQVSNYRDFSITISFKDDSGVVPTQTVTKKFQVSEKDGEEVLLSEAVEVQWPQELADICPSTIREKKKGDSYSADEKKKYRQGMKSFFAWFEWTGHKPAKEFRSGEDLARLILDDLFPNAVRYYAEAIKNDNGSDVDSSEGEELDISDEDEPPKKKQKGE
ncbi:CIC11C00000002988 [Sungouiella intermedia]|uniref:CIC11C00000002988 n=1 Tax=Sungouiella intermedia TaxID=45354 RepID=A0A1L0DKD5_9ASCO|nr:CIC11C00000002988 [[Candida] intermedia]